MASSGTFSTWNPLRYSSTSGITYSQGNCKVESTSGYPVIMNNFAPRTGKWYIEFYNHENNGYNVLGIVQGASIDEWGNWLPNRHYQKQYMWYSHNGNKSTRNSDGTGNTSSYGSSWGSGNQIIGCALDMDNGKVWWSLNGTFQASGDPAAGTNAAFDDLDTSDGFYMAYSDYNSGADGIMGINCGQDSTFGGAITAGTSSDANGFGNFKYSPPSGFLALCTANLPTATGVDPAETDNDHPQKQFNAKTYTGNGSTQSINIGFQPDLVWVKNRGTTNSNIIFDSSRGATKDISSDKDAAEGTAYSSIFGGFTSTGFDLDSADAGMNNSTNNYIAWCWRANGGTTATNTSGTITTTVQVNTAAGFSIVTYTGTGSNATIGHGLSAAPDFALFKRRSSQQNWAVYHSALGGTYNLVLNGNNAKATGSAFWQDTDTSSSVITIGTEGRVNQSTGTYVAYVWHSVEGYSKFGSFEGNSNANGPYIYTGFRPRLVVCKAVDATENWQIRDTGRNSNTGSQVRLYWNANTAEGTASTASPIDFLSSGFKVRGSNSEINTNTIVYAAWADVPFKYNNTHSTTI